jgi:predicted nucleic acid-binding protein
LGLIVLPDTNVWIDLIRPEGGLEDNRHFIAMTRDASIVMSAVCRYELENGIAGRAGRADKRRALDALLVTYLEEAPFNTAAAVEASRINAHARKIGKGLSATDAMIAGHAASLGAALLTGDTRIVEALPDDVATLHWVAPSQVARKGSARP